MVGYHIRPEVRGKYEYKQIMVTNITNILIP